MFKVDSNTLSNNKLYQNVKEGKPLFNTTEPPSSHATFFEIWKGIHQARKSLSKELKNKVVKESLKKAEFDLTTFFRRTFNPDLLLLTSGGTIRINTSIAKDWSKFFEAVSKNRNPSSSIEISSKSNQVLDAPSQISCISSVIPPTLPVPLPNLEYPKEYFNAKERALKLSCKEGLIVPGEVNYTSLRDVVHYFYTGHIKLKTGNITDVCCMADFFDAPDLLANCDLFLAKHVEKLVKNEDSSQSKLEKIGEIWKLASKLCFPKTAQHCLQFLLFLDQVPKDLPPVSYTLKALDLSISSKEVTDKTIATLCKLVPYLESLNLKNCEQVTDQGLRLIFKSYNRTLKSLNLAGAKSLTIDVCRGLDPLVKLQELYLDRTNKIYHSGTNKIDPSFIKSLASLNSLEKLSLDSFTYLSAVEVSGIARIGTLTRLDLTGAMFIKDEDLASLKSLPLLNHLILNSCSALTPNIDNIVKDFPSLKVLETKNCPNFLY